MSKTLHMRLDVRGALSNWDNRKLKALASCFTVDGKQLQTAAECRSFLLDCLEEGKRFLPMGECEGFWDKQMCPGHPVDVDLGGQA